MGKALFYDNFLPNRNWTVIRAVRNPSVMMRNIYCVSDWIWFCGEGNPTPICNMRNCSAQPYDSFAKSEANSDLVLWKCYFRIYLDCDFGWICCLLESHAGLFCLCRDLKKDFSLSRLNALSSRWWSISDRESIDRWSMTFAQHFLQKADKSVVFGNRPHKGLCGRVLLHQWFLRLSRRRPRFVSTPAIRVLFFGVGVFEQFFGVCAENGKLLMIF